jgi:putative Mg2+ transporter-C (MgtC) family protein
MAMGGLIGWERETRRKAAGLRTNILICMGAAAFTLVSVIFRGGTTDVSRVAAQIVTGIGFLGAGSIIRARGGVQGLTTAATIWVVAAIGLAVGAGYYSLAAVTTGMVILALIILGRMELVLAPHEEAVRYEIRIRNTSHALEEVQKLLDDSGVEIHSQTIRKDDAHVDLKLHASATGAENRRLTRLLNSLPDVEEIRRS